MCGHLASSHHFNLCPPYYHPHNLQFWSAIFLSLLIGVSTPKNLLHHLWCCGLWIVFMNGWSYVTIPYHEGVLWEIVTIIWKLWFMPRAKIWNIFHMLWYLRIQLIPITYPSNMASLFHNMNMFGIPQLLTCSIVGLIILQ